MNDGYIMYRCETCNKMTILLSEEVTHSEKESIYITCGHNGKHKRLRVVGRYDNLKECMEKQRTYIRKNRTVHQTK